MTYLQFLKRVDKDVLCSFYVIYGGDTRVQQDVIDVLAMQRGAKVRTVLGESSAEEYTRWLYGVPSKFCVVHWKKGTDTSGLESLFSSKTRGVVIVVDDSGEAVFALRRLTADRKKIGFVDCEKRPSDMEMVIKLRGNVDGISFDELSREEAKKYGLSYFLNVYSILRRLGKKSIKYKEVESFFIFESDVHVGKLLIEKGKQYLFKHGLFPEESSKFFKSLYTMLVQILLVQSVKNVRYGDKATHSDVNRATINYYMNIAKGMGPKEVYRRLHLVLLYLSRRGVVKDGKDLVAQFLFRW